MYTETKISNAIDNVNSIVKVETQFDKDNKERPHTLIVRCETKLLIFEYKTKLELQNDLDKVLLAIQKRNAKSKALKYIRDIKDIKRYIKGISKSDMSLVMSYLNFFAKGEVDLPDRCDRENDFLKNCKTLGDAFAFVLGEEKYKDLIEKAIKDYKEDYPNKIQRWLDNRNINYLGFIDIYDELDTYEELDLDLSKNDDYDFIRILHYIVDKYLYDKLAFKGRTFRFYYDVLERIVEKLENYYNNGSYGGLNKHFDTYEVLYQFLLAYEDKQKIENIFEKIDILSCYSFTGKYCYVANGIIEDDNSKNIELEIAKIKECFDEKIRNFDFNDYWLELYTTMYYSLIADKYKKNM